MLRSTRFRGCRDPGQAVVAARCPAAQSLARHSGGARRRVTGFGRPAMPQCLQSPFCGPFLGNDSASTARTAHGKRVRMACRDGPGVHTLRRHCSRAGAQMPKCPNAQMPNTGTVRRCGHVRAVCHGMWVGVPVAVCRRELGVWVCRWRRRGAAR